MRIAALLAVEIEKSIPSDGTTAAAPIEQVDLRWWNPGHFRTDLTQEVARDLIPDCVRVVPVGWSEHRQFLLRFSGLPVTVELSLPIKNESFISDGIYVVYFGPSFLLFVTV